MRKIDFHHHAYVINLSSYFWICLNLSLPYWQPTPTCQNISTPQILPLLEIIISPTYNERRVQTSAYLLGLPIGNLSMLHRKKNHLATYPKEKPGFSICNYPETTLIFFFFSENNFSGRSIFFSNVNVFFMNFFFWKAEYLISYFVAQKKNN